MSLSSVRSETALRSRLFSSSRSFRRFTCSVFSPPNSWPPIIRHLAHPDLADCVRHGLPLRDQNINLSQLRNDLFRLVRFLAITVLLDVKDIPQVGPLQWGRISETGDFNGLTLSASGPVFLGSRGFSSGKARIA